MLAVRGGKHDCVHIRIAENLLIAVDQREVVLAAEFLRRGARAGVGEHEADVAALAGVLPLHRTHERAPPAPKPHHRRSDHRITPSCIMAVLVSARHGHPGLYFQDRKGRARPQRIPALMRTAAGT